MQIHLKIIKALFISSFIIALIVAAFTIYIQISQVGNKVLLLAKQEVKYFIENIKQQHSLTQNDIDLNDTNFLSIIILDNQNNILDSHTVENYQTIQRELKKIDHHIVTKSTRSVQERVIHNQIQNKFYFEFKVPLHFQNFNGAIRGLYQVSDEELQTIYTNILYSVLQIVLTVFFTTVLLYPIIVYLNKQYMEQSENLLNANMEIMSVLGGAISKRDNETNAHNYRVTLYAVAFGEALNLDHAEMMGLLKGAFLHDVGKIGISDSILLKAGKLNNSEFEQMKYHVKFGIDIISQSKWLNDAKEIVAYHHEKYDGTGYRENLSGKEIPLNARIFMICDVFDALTSKRPYKKKFSFEESIHIIKEKSGTHFDPELVTIFCTIIKPLYTNIANIEDEDSLKLLLEDKLYYLIPRNNQ